MSRRRFRTAQDIENQVRIPETLPLGETPQSYKKRIANQIMSSMAKGNSFEEASQGLITTSHRKKKSRSNKGLVAAVTGVSVLALSGMTATGMALLTPEKTDAITATSEEEKQLSEVAADRTLLLVGTDKRPEKDVGYGTSGDVPGVRTDTIVLFSLYDDGNRAITVSLPRDLSVDTDGCDMYDHESNTYLSVQNPSEVGVKINSVYQDGGPKCLVNTVEDLTGMPIDGYAEVDLSSFSEIIDSIGGIDMHFDTPIIDDTLGVIAPEAGMNHLDGRQVLDLARARKVDGTNKNDLERIDRQKDIMAAVAQKIKNSDLSAPHLYQLFSTVMDKLMVDNISLSDGVSLANTVLNLPEGALVMTTYPIAGDLPGGNLQADKTAAEKLFSDISDGTLLSTPDEGSSEKEPLRAEATRLNKKPIVISAPSEHDLRAHQLGEMLEQFGARVTYTQNGRDNDTSTIYAAPGSPGVAVNIASMFPDSHITGKDPHLVLPENVTMITVGSDYNQVFMHNKDPKMGVKGVIPQDKEIISRDIFPPEVPTGDVLSNDSVKTL